MKKNWIFEMGKRSMLKNQKKRVDDDEMLIVFILHSLLFVILKELHIKIKETLVRVCFRVIFTHNYLVFIMDDFK